MCHAGVEILLDFLIDNFCGINLNQIITKVVKDCTQCKLIKNNQIITNFYPILEEESDVGLSILKLPKNKDQIKYGIVLVNLFSGHVKIYPIMRFSIRTIIWILRERYFNEVFIPRKIRVDEVLSYNEN